MSNENQIVYKVLTSSGSGGGWQEQGRTADMNAARRKAESLHSSKKFRSVKVDKEFMDGANDRMVSATIFSMDLNASTGVSIYLLLALAACGGLVSFVVTLFLTGSNF